MYIAKLSYNSNNWTKPSGKNGKLVSNNFVQFYESENGFGWEEWNFSSERMYNNERYGFIQAIHNNDSNRRKNFENVFLFTQINNFFYIVAYFEEITSLGFAESREFKSLIGHSIEMKNDVAKIKGNLKQFDRDINLSINFKFKNCTFLYDENKLDQLKFTPLTGQNSFKDIFQIKNEKKIKQLEQILNSRK